MHVQARGYVVLKVRDLEQSEVFYAAVLGTRIVSRIPDPPMTFFRCATSENQHDLRPDGAESRCSISARPERPPSVWRTWPSRPVVRPRSVARRGSLPSPPPRCWLDSGSP